MIKQGCFECGSEATTQHHVVPRSRGGVNTVPLCDQCHGQAHGRSMATKTLTREAMAHKKSKGERVGTVPFGYDLAADGITLVENADQLRAIELIHSLRTKGYTLQAIATELEAAGVATKKGLAKWSPTTIRAILNRNKAAAEHTTVYTLSRRVDKTSKR
jgi:hypothetical protein